MEYRIRYLTSFEPPFAKLDRSIQKRVAEKIDSLAANAETIGSPMKNLPPELHGLHKVRVGGWRIFFWIDRQEQEITLYDIDRRDKAYKRILK